MTETVIYSSDELLATSRDVLPGGSLGTYVMPDEAAFVVSHGAGSRVYSLEGRSYIDYVLGSGPMLLGHAHPTVVEAVSEQVGRGSQFYWLTTATIELADLLVRAIPCAEQVKFCSTGGEATFFALRLARAFTGREKIVRFLGSYHGGNDYSMSGGSAGIPTMLKESVLSAPFNNLEATAALVREHPHEIAAIIVEPLQRIVPPVPGFLEGLRQLADESGAVLIFDEVVTGFRLAWGGAQERYDVIPDLATYGKVIGGGYALAAVAGRGEILNLTNPRAQGDQYAYMSGTLNGNPVSAAAGLATLRVLEETDPYRRLDELGERLRAGLRELGASLPRPLQVVGDGAVFGLAFTDGDPTDPVAIGSGDKTGLRKLEAELLEQGILANAPAKFYVSAVHSDEDLATTLEAMGEILPRCCGPSEQRH